MKNFVQIQFKFSEVTGPQFVPCAKYTLKITVFVSNLSDSYE